MNLGCVQHPSSHCSQGLFQIPAWHLSTGVRLRVHTCQGVSSAVGFGNRRYQGFRSGVDRVCEGFLSSTKSCEICFTHRSCHGFGSTQIGWQVRYPTVRAASRVPKRRRQEPGISVTSIVQSLSATGVNAVQVLETQARSLEPSDWFTMMEVLGKQRRWLLALEVFRWMQQQRWYKPDNGFYSKLISIMGKEKQLRLAIWLFKEFRKNGGRPDTSLYNAVITAHIRSKDMGRGFERALVFLEEMKTKPRCLPNVVTYNILLRACAQLGDFERVNGFFKEMQEAGISPDVFSYNGILDAYGKAGNYLQMEQTLALMRGDHIKPDLVTYNILIDAYGRARAFSKMEQVFKSMSGAKSKHKPELKTYNSLMWNYGKAGEVEQMESVLSRLEDAGLKPNLITYEVLITGYGHIGAFHKVGDCLDRLGKVGMTPQLSTLNALVGAYCEHKLFEEAEGLLSNAGNLGLHPRASSYLILLRAYGEDGRRKEMGELLERMDKKHVLPNRATFLEFLGSYGLSVGSKTLDETDSVVEAAVPDLEVEEGSTDAEFFQSSPKCVDFDAHSASEFGILTPGLTASTIL